jgi:hypothetical protein
MQYEYGEIAKEPPDSTTHVTLYDTGGARIGSVRLEFVYGRSSGGDSEGALLRIVQEVEGRMKVSHSPVGCAMVFDANDDNDLEPDPEAAGGAARVSEMWFEGSNRSLARVRTWPSGHPEQVHEFQYVYDAERRVRRISGPGGWRSEFTYDADNRVESLSCPGDQPIHLVRSADGLLSGLVLPGGRRVAIVNGHSVPPTPDVGRCLSKLIYYYALHGSRLTLVN